MRTSQWSACTFWDRVSYFETELCAVYWPLVEPLALIACAMVYSLNLESHCVEQTARRDVLLSAIDHVCYGLLSRPRASLCTTSCPTRQYCHKKKSTRQCSHKKSRQYSHKKTRHSAVLSQEISAVLSKVIYLPHFDEIYLNPWLSYYYFRFRFWPIHRHLHGKLHRRIKFHPNRSTHGGVMTSYRWRHSDTNLLLVKIYVYTKCRWDIPIHGRIITTSGFGKQTPYWNFTSGLKSDYIRHLDMLPVIFEPSLVAEEAQKFFCQSVNQFSRYVNFLIPSFMLENAHFCPFGEVFGNWPLNIVRYCRDPKRHILGRTHAFWRINRHDRSRKCDRGSWRRKRY